MRRREFLAGMGGLVAASALPAWAGDEPALYAKRGVYERLELSYQHVAIGLKKPFSILHISDTHFCEAYPHESPELIAWARSRKQTFGGRQEESLADALAWAKENVDYVLHTGDLIDFQSEANLDLVRKYFGTEANRLFGTTGNHDYQRLPRVQGVSPTAEYNAPSRPILQKAFNFDVAFHATVINGVNFVCIEQVYGTVMADQVERFRAEAKKGLPIVLCMHAPFMTDHLWRADCKFWKTRQRFAGGPLPDARGDYKRQNEDPTTQAFLAYLRQEPLLKAILAGHMHIDVQDRFSPTAMQYVVGANFLPHGEEILFT